MQPDSSHNGLTTNDILFMLYQHKWKVIFFSLLGLAAALFVKVGGEQEYESKSKIMVRYLLENSIDSKGDPQITFSESTINSEIEILTSLDLAKEVAETLGPDKFFTEVEEPITVDMAARAIAGGLEATSAYGSNIILLTYKNTNPDLCDAVLRELLTSYFKMHLDIHRSVGAFDFVSQQTDQMRSRLGQTDAELKRLKAEAGVLSVASSIDGLDQRRESLQEQMMDAEMQRAEALARTQEMESAFGIGASEEGEDAASARPDPETVATYETLVEEIDRLKTRDAELARFGPSSRLVVNNRNQITLLENERRALLQEHPNLLSAVTTTSGAGGGGQADAQAVLQEQRANLMAAEARIAVLKSKMADLNEVTSAISQSGGQIESLERRKSAEEERLLYFENALERARIDEALDPTKIPNISVVQNPSPAEVAPMASMTKKILMLLAGGGIALGVGLALLIEMVLRRRIQRPDDVERRLGLGLMLSIPFLGKNNHRNALMLETGPADYRLRPYAKTIRDRLCYMFDAQNMVHQPKLIALTGLTKGAGTSSLAAALAASFSENGNQRVLLVDMSVDMGDQPLLGKKEVQFKEVKDNLYLASTRYGEEGEAQSSRITTNRLYELLPKFKASDFAYIIFDLPPFSPTSMTMFMDNVLLVLDAENTNQDKLNRAYGELAKGNHNVSCVFNKSAPKAPQWLCGTM